MHQISALIFPGTFIPQEIAAQLLLFFNKIYFYQPAEHKNDNKRGQAPLNSLYGAKGLCQGYPPFPLGDDLTRFNQTIKELYSNWDIYGKRAQKQALSSHYIEKYKDRDEASIDSLVTKLSKNQTPGKISGFHNAEDTNELWKARIVLKLAEQFDFAENEIKQDLAKLTTSENKMFKALHGNVDNETNNILSDQMMPRFSPFGAGTMEQRLRAWGQLYLSEQKAGTLNPEYRLLTTTKKEAVDLIISTYADISGIQPVRLFSLPLATLNEPAITSTEPKSTFHKAVGDSLNFLHNFLLEMISGEKTIPVHDDEKSQLEEEITYWSAIVKNHFQQFGNKKLSFYSFPGISVHQLFDQFLHQTRQIPSGELPKKALGTCLLGALEE